MKEYFYEVRGTNDPIDGDHVRFNSKQEALNYADKFSGSTVYMLEYEFSDIDPYSGGKLTQELQIRGPEVDAIVKDPNIPNSCDADNPDNYDENGNFRMPDPDTWFDQDIDEYLVETADDEEDEFPDAFDDIVDYLKADEEEAISGYDKAIDKVEDDFVKDQLDKIATEEEAHKDYLDKVVEDPTVEYTEPLEDKDESEAKDLVDKKADEALTEDAKYAGDYRGFSIYKEVNGGYWAQKGYTDDVFDKEFASKREIQAAIDELIASRGRSGMIDTYGDDDDEYNESLNDESDDIESESFAEELFSALSATRDERAFPDGKLEQEPPHKDVPVVKCKVNPAITHSEDEKPLVEGNFWGGNDDDSEVAYVQIRGYDTEEDFKNGDASMIEAADDEEAFFNNCKQDVDNGEFYAIVMGDFSCKYDEEEVEYDDKFTPTKVYPEGLDVNHLTETLTEASEDLPKAFDPLEDDPASQMYIAREIVYSLVDDAESAQKLSAWGDSLEFDEQVALDSLIADALEGANEHEAMMDYIDDRTLPITLSNKTTDATKRAMDNILAACTTEQQKLDVLFIAINHLVLDGYLE